MLKFARNFCTNGGEYDMIGSVVSEEMNADVTATLRGKMDILCNEV